MKKFFSILITALVLSLSFSYTGYAWTIDRDFNSGVLGTKANATADGFDHDANGSVYSNAQSVDGTQSAKAQIKQGTTGFGYWGGIIDFPLGGVGKGGKIYFEIDVYIPNIFKAISGNTSTKFLRFYGKRADGTNGGSLDIQITDNAFTFSEFRMLKEYQYKWFDIGNNGIMTRDTWHQINVELGVDEVPRAQGGGSYVKFWLDDVLLKYEQRVQTIVQPTEKVINFLLFTYYNNGSPIDQHVWIDNIIISDVKPSWWDTLGTGLPPPSPPVAN
jgi:hypothetical protein